MGGMKKRMQFSKNTVFTAMMLAVGFNIVLIPTADAFLGAISQGVSAIGAAVQAGTNFISGIQGLFGGGGGGGAGAAVASGVPTVSNGGILPGPANAAYGVSYVRDVFLPNLTNWVVAAVLAGSVIVLIVAGIMYLVGGGSQELQTKARETIIWGIIGMVVTVFSYALVRIVITINYLG